MITKIHLHNFQKHSDLILDIEDLITVIQGSSDKGKSSIVRALYWIFFNRPLGSDVFKKEGTKDFFALITFNGHDISRGKDKEGPYYKLDTEYFRGIGTDIPEPISQLLNVDTLNISGQHDPAFLLSMSKPEASRFLSSLVGLEEMDKALSIIEGKRRKANAELTTLEHEKDEIKQQLKSLKRVPVMQKKINKMNELDEHTQKMKHDRESLLRLKEMTLHISEKLTKKTDYDTLYILVCALLQTQDEYGSLESRCEQYKRTGVLLQHVSLLNKARNALFQAQNKQSAIVEQKKKESSLRRSVTLYTNIVQDLETSKQVTQRLQKEWREKAKGLCPLCNKPMEEVCEH